MPNLRLLSEDLLLLPSVGAVHVRAAAADVVISYLPEASMGSAVEIHAAKAAGKTILAVAPGTMAQNWVVRSFSARTFEDIPALAWFLKETRGGADVA